MATSGVISRIPPTPIVLNQANIQLTNMLPQPDFTDQQHDRVRPFRSRSNVHFDKQ